LIVLEAASNYLRRYALLSREMAGKEKNAQWKGDLLKIASNCDWGFGKSTAYFLGSYAVVIYMATTILLYRNKRAF